MEDGIDEGGFSHSPLMLRRREDDPARPQHVGTPSDSTNPVVRFRGVANQVAPIAVAVCGSLVIATFELRCGEIARRSSEPMRCAFSGPC